MLLLENFINYFYMHYSNCQLNYLIISFEIQCAFFCHSIDCLIHLININSIAIVSNVFLTIKTLVYLWNICVTNYHGYVVPLVVKTSRSFPHSWLITRFVTRLTRWVPRVAHELFTLPELFSIQCAFFCHSIDCLIHLININSIAIVSNVFLTIKTLVYQRRYQNQNPQIFHLS
jgi:hypothetical protein